MNDAQRRFITEFFKGVFVDRIEVTGVEFMMYDGMEECRVHTGNYTTILEFPSDWNALMNNVTMEVSGDL